MSDITSRLQDAVAGRYRIERELGEGGMASVYLAEDLKHERKVALKILKPELAALLGAERFLAEIKTTANLQHPHILPLFDSGESDGFLYYVMPYVEGESLRQRLDREKQLGVEEAVGIARGVADALDYAHRKDIVHRDIKPANILLQDGRPVVADFGIALAVSAAGAGRMTETGLSLGTPHYMSPEQASADRDLSPRSDIYSLGCVLYEMLAGQPPHTGPSAQSVLVRILTEDPRPVTEVRRSVPENVAATVMKAIEKLPADRFDSARAFIQALEDPAFTHVAVSRSVTGRTASAATAASWRARRRFATLLPWMLAGAFAGVAAWLALRPTVQAPTVRTPMAFGAIKPDAGFGDLRIAPNGAAFAVVFDTANGHMLAVREADESDFRVIPGAEGVTGTAFSPDGTWIAYGNENGGLMKVAVSGGAPEPVIPKGSYRPLDWGADGHILFYAYGGDRSVQAVPSTGGESTLIFHGSALSGQFLPGGNVLLGVLREGARFVDVAADTSWIVVPGALSPHFLPRTSQLLWVDGSGALWAADFDPSSGSLGRRRGIVLEGVTNVRGGTARYDVSDQGTLVYSTGGSGSGGTPKEWLVTVAMDGSVTKKPLSPRMMYEPRWSPDGRFVAYYGSEPEAGTATSPQIYTYDMRLESRPRRLTSKGRNALPVWSPDGSRLVFASMRDGTKGFDLFVKNVNDEEPPRLLLSLPGDQRPYDWFAPDSILISSGSNWDIWVVVLPPKGSADSATAHPFFKSESRLIFGTLAPQHDLVAYVSTTGGTPGIYVRTFPNAGAPEQITEAIASPQWSADGKTIYYWRGGRADSLWAARIDRGPPFAVLSNRPVLPWGDSLPAHGDLNRTGNRFVTTMRDSSAETPAGAAAHVRFFVVTNWFPELRARLAGGG